MALIGHLVSTLYFFVPVCYVFILCQVSAKSKEHLLVVFVYLWVPIISPCLTIPLKPPLQT